MDAATGTPEVLTLDDLEPYLLLKNGNLLYKVPFRGGWAVLKVYYGSRGFWETLAKSMGNVVFEGQTSYFPKARLRHERECLELWGRHGFRVFQVYDAEVRAPGLPRDGYLLLEYVDAPKLDGYLCDASIDVETRMETWRRWLKEWGRRHALAEREREPLLVHENGDLGHVMIMPDGGFLWFDFEMVFRSRTKVPRYVGHEIIQYLWYLFRNVPPELHGRLLEETVAHYPDRERLRRAPDVFLAPPGVMRLARAIDSRRARAQKPTSKYNVARRLREAIDKAGG